MDGVTLHRLGKRLTELAAEVVRTSTPDEYTPAEKAVLAGLLERPASTAAELVATTGFGQSHVSATVARLEQRGLVVGATDPADTRRRLLSLTPTARRGVRRRLDRPVGDVLAGALGDADARRVEQLLTELATLLLVRPG